MTADHYFAAISKRRNSAMFADRCAARCDYCRETGDESTPTRPSRKRSAAAPAVEPPEKRPTANHPIQQA